MAAETDWVKVASAKDPWEAQLLRGLLEGAGFPVQVLSRGSQAMVEILGTPAVGQFLDLWVPPDVAAEARALLAAPPLDQSPDDNP